MKGTSKVIMGATLIMVVSIAIVLGLVLVLLAELYCSLLLRRGRLRAASTSNIPSSLLLSRRRRLRAASTSNIPNSNAAATTNDGSPQHDQDLSGTPSLSAFYAQGVLHAPRNFLFPAVYCNESNEDLEKQHDSQFPKFCQSPTHHLHQHAYSLSSSPSFAPLAPPKLIHEVPPHCSTSTSNDEGCGGSNKETCICICNPIYDNDASRPSRVDTPFETPDSSPSRLDTNGSSGEDDNNDNGQSTTSSPSSRPMTPPLTPMKKLPAEACSISLRDTRKF